MDARPAVLDTAASELPFPFPTNPLDPWGGRSGDAVADASRTKLRRKLRQTCPTVPGVYGMLDRQGELIYVGKSKSLRSRLQSYFSDSNSDSKAGRIVEGARVIQWETQPSEFAALLREQQLIRAHSPRWNVQGVPKRQRPVYLCLGRKPAMFFLATKPPAGTDAVEGPFYGLGRMREVVEALNKTFKLRDCSAKQVFRFADQQDLFDMEYRPGCLRLETETCLGPCAAACSHTDYRAAVNAAESFLDGFNHEPLIQAQDAFERAMEHRQYELAGRQHRLMRSLEYVDRKLALLATARRIHTFVYRSAGYDGRNVWYLVHSGEIVDVMAEPRRQATSSRIQNEAPVFSTEECRRQLNRWKRQTSDRLSRGHGPYPQTLAIVASWFRKHRSELEHTSSPNELIQWTKKATV